MAFTKWSFFWGGDIPNDPTFWGGNEGDIITGPTPPDPPESRVPFSAVWLADDEAAPFATPPVEAVAGDTMGWVPNATGGVFYRGGDISLVVMKSAISSDQTFNIVRGDAEGSQEILSDDTELIHQVHAEPYSPVLLTGEADLTASFVGLTQDGGDLGIGTWSFLLDDILAAPNKVATVWDNELQVSVDTMRMASLPRFGTLLVIPKDGELYLRSLFTSSGVASPAQKINIDLRPREDWELDLSRLHVVCTADGTLIFYYGIKKTFEGDRGTAVMAYTPHHPGFTVDLPFSASGMVYDPSVFVLDLVPTVSHKGASRHLVSNDILVALQALDAEFLVKPQNIHWLTARGLGVTPDPVEDVWDEENHPHLFGGQLITACPDNQINLLSINGTGGRQQGGFQVLGNVAFGPVQPGNDAFINTYALDDSESQQAARRLLVGNVSVASNEEANTGGNHTVQLVRTAAMYVEEAKRQGYNLTHDILTARLSSRLDEVIVGQTVEIDRGIFPGVADLSVTPTVGMVGTSLFLPEASSSVVFPGSIAYDERSVCISLWVYPQRAERGGASNQYSIVHRFGATADAYRLAWNEVGSGGTFVWEVTTDIDGMVSISTPAELPPDRWYHITVLYNKDTYKSQLFVFGILMDENAFTMGAEMDIDFVTHQPVTLGFPTGTAHTSMLGRVDDFVLSVSEITEQQVVASFFDSTVALDGPVRTSRSNDVTRQDHVFSTASIPTPGVELGIYTVAARSCNFHAGGGFHSHVVFDVWKLPRGLDSVPKYLGTLAPPASSMNRIASDGIGTGVLKSPSIVSFPVDGSNRAIDFDIRLIYDINSSGSATGKLRLYMLFENDPETDGTDKFTFYHVTFDPENPIISGQDENSYVYVYDTAANKRPTSWTVVNRPIDSKDVLITTVSDTVTPADSEMVLLHEDKYGAVGTPNTRPMLDILPETTGNFGGLDYSTAYSTSGRGPSARGMIARTLTNSGEGWPASLEGDIQVVFGFESTVGGSEIPATSPHEQLVSTVVFLIPDGEIAGPPTGDFDIHAGLMSKQLDEYGVFGIDPFIPLGYATNPGGVTGNSLVLGVSGNRDTTSPGREGQGGLTLYTIKREWNWGARPLLDAGPLWGSGQNACTGASIAIDQREDTVTDNPDGIIWVARPMFDRTDRYSVIYMSDSEAADSGYEVPAGLNNPVMRRSDRNSGVVWEGFLLESPSYSSRRTGAVVKEGTKRKAVVTLRYSHPGWIFPEPV